MKATRTLLAIFIILLIFVSSKAEAKKYKKILGVWEFSAPNAPQPYDSGSMAFKEIDSKLAGEFIIQGQAMAIPQIKFEEKILTLGFEVENTPITLMLHLKDGKLEGTTDSPGGQVAVTAIRVKKVTK